jgi:hypothetical protein
MHRASPPAIATMSTPQPHDPDPARSDPRVAGLRERWTARYGARIAAQLEPDRRYSLVKVGGTEYAFTSYDRYVAALKHVWSAELVPEPRPSALGSELLEVAPDLRGVDPGFDDLPAADVDDGPRFS